MAQMDFEVGRDSKSGWVVRRVAVMHKKGSV